MAWYDSLLIFPFRCSTFFYHLSGTVIRLTEVLFAVNVALLFGLTSSGGIWGRFADALCAILRASGIGPLAKWVDDFVFFRILLCHMEDYNHRQKLWAQRIQEQGGRRQTNSRVWFAGGVLPDETIEEYDNDLSNPITAQPSSSSHSFSYDLSDVDTITDPLGVPFEPSKQIDFCDNPIYFGFYWCISSRIDGLPDKKKAKYQSAIEKWQETRKHDLLEAQKLYGKLSHACHVVPSGRAYLVSLEHFMSVFGDSPSMPRSPPRSLAADLRWWHDRLSKSTIERPLPAPVELLDIGAYSDASSSVGLGVVVNGAWRAWSLLPGWKSDKRDIAWAEAIAVEIVARCILPSFPPASHIKIYCDNKTVVDGWKFGRSRNEQVNGVFKRIHQLCEDHESFIHLRYVQSGCNPADGPSRGEYPKGPLLALPDFPDEILQHLRLITEGEIAQSHSKETLNVFALPKPSSVLQEDIAEEDTLDDVARELLEHQRFWEY